MLKSARGRPTKFNRRTQEAILKMIVLGCTFEHSAQAAGVNYRTMRYWLVQGEKEGKGPYFHFFHALKKAEAKFVENQLGVINKAADRGVWQAAAWLLERRYPEYYGRNRHQIEGDINIRHGVMIAPTNFHTSDLNRIRLQLKHEILPSDMKKLGIPQNEHSTKQNSFKA